MEKMDGKSDAMMHKRNNADMDMTRQYEIKTNTMQDMHFINMRVWYRHCFTNEVFVLPMWEVMGPSVLTCLHFSTFFFVAYDQTPLNKCVLASIVHVQTMLIGSLSFYLQLE